MAKKVGSVYAEIRADIKKLQTDFDKAHDVTKKSAKRIQDTLDKGINFEKMAAGAVAAAASIYGAFRSVQQVIESARVGSVLDKQVKSFDNLSIAAGTSSKKILDALKESSRGLVSETDLMAAAGKAMLMSIPAKEITELMKIAEATSRMTGQSITKAFEDITLGVARQSRMILDNLGIIVSVDDANNEYAKTLGKTSGALTDAERRQAFMNAVLKSGADMIERIGNQGGSLDGVNKLIAAQSDLWAEVNKTVATFLDEELAGYAKVLKWIADTLKGMKSEKVSGTMSDMRKEIEMLRSLESKGMAQPGSTMRKMAEFNSRFGGGSESEIANRDAYKKYKESEADKFTGAERVSDNTISYDVEARWKAYEEEIKIREKAADEALKIRERFVADYQKATMSESQFAIAEIDRQAEEYRKAGVDKIKIEEWYAAEILKIDNKVWDERQKIVDETLKLHEAAAKEEAKAYEESWVREAEGANRSLMEKVAEYEKANKSLIDLTERTAEAMQENFSNLFFDAMTGKLKTFEDYAKAVFDSIARMMSDLAAQQLTRGLFGPEMNGGGWLSSLAGMIGGSGSAANLPINQPGYPGAATMHSGGIVGVNSGPMRSIPASYFATAPRLHQGLAADEYPAVLQKGEQVIPKGGGKSQPIVHMHFYSQNGKYDRESVSQAQSGLYASLSRAKGGTVNDRIYRVSALP